jgi:hypothetical protein
MRKVYRITMQEQDAQGEFQLTDIVEFETSAQGNVFEVLDIWRAEVAQRDRDERERDQYAQAYEQMAANPANTLESAIVSLVLSDEYWHNKEYLATERAILSLRQAKAQL